MKFNKDFFIVAGVMTGILLPVRLLFVEFVSNDTWGSLGLISAISVIIVILVKKGKLGKFGKMFEREMLRLTSGKRRVFVFSMITIMVVYFSLSITLIDSGNTIYLEEKERIMVQVFDHYGDIDFENPESVLETLEPEQVVSGIPDYANSFLNDYKSLAITQAIVNDFSNGFILHFHSVFLIEGLELLGVYVFYTITLRGKKEVTI